MARKTNPPAVITTGGYVEPANITLRRNIVRLTDLWSEKTGNSLSEFHRRAGIGKSAFWYYRSGDRTPSMRVLTQMAGVLGLPVEVFFRR